MKDRFDKLYCRENIPRFIVLQFAGEIARNLIEKGDPIIIFSASLKYFVPETFNQHCTRKTLVSMGFFTSFLIL